MTKNYLKFKSRIILVHIFVMSAWVLFGVTLFNIQVINKIEQPQGIKLEAIKGERGNFLDTNGNSLTQNLTFYRIGVHPKKISNLDEFVSDLSDCTERKKDFYFQIYDSNKNYLELEKKTLKNCESLQKKYQNSLIIKKSFKRYYPEENLVSQLIGFTNVDDSGISGLELEYEKYLKPKDGSRLYKRNGLGQKILDPTLKINQAENGADISLTINKEYQAVLREELINSIEVTSANSAMGLILNPQTGEILSMVSIPDYNPNSPNDFEVEYQKNKLVTDLYEPGSTFKIVTMAAALENGINLTDEYNVEGPYNFHNIKEIEDTEPNTVLNVKEILAFSSNIGTVKIAESLGKKNIYNQAREFGFGIKTGYNDKTEASGTFRDVNKWSLSSMYSIPMGYEISVTPLQMAMAYSAIANGGFMLKPFVVREIKKSNNSIIKNQRSSKKRILEQSDAKKLKDMLHYTVENGSGKMANIDGWDIAGKTGTAKKYIDGKYSEEEFYSSFVGFFPKENPQILGLIIIDGADPSRKLHYGSLSAAPVFRSVMKRIINIDKNISNNRKDSSKSNKPLLIQKNVKKKQEYVVMPDMVGKNVQETYTILRKIGIRPQISGRGLIVYQDISPGEKVLKQSISILKAEIKE